MSDERRTGQRRRALLLAEVDLPGAPPVAGLMYDLGEDGCCLLCDPLPEIANGAPAPERPLRVAVAAMGVRFTAWLVNRHGCRLGVKFGAMDERARAFLRDCLRTRPAGA